MKHDEGRGSKGMGVVCSDAITSKNSFDMVHGSPEIFLLVQIKLMIKMI